jgi:hypothetical protein
MFDVHDGLLIFIIWEVPTYFHIFPINIKSNKVFSSSSIISSDSFMNTNWLHKLSNKQDLQMKNLGK